MYTPMILKIYESKECEGVLAPFILSSEISELVYSLYNKNTKLYNLLQSISDVTSVSGGVKYDNTKRVYGISHCSCDGTNSVDSSAIKSLKGSSALTEAEKVAANNKTQVLPPHKVHFNTNGDPQPVYESNIYTPCLHEPSDHFAPEVKAGIFPTGTYPNEVPTYSSMEEYSEVASNTIESNATSNCSCSATSLHSEQEKMSLKKRCLEKELIYNSFEGIKDMQISNLLSALIQSNKVPLNYELIQTLRIILDTVVSNNVSIQNIASMVKRIGIYSQTARSISCPDTKTYLKVFVQVDAECHKDSVTNILKSVLSSYSENISVVLFNPNEFASIQQTFPINLCFDCSISEDISTPIATFDMILINANTFVTNVKIHASASRNVQIASPSPIMEVPQGTSGELQFIVHSVGDRAYTVDKIRVNNKVYSISELISKNNSIADFGYSGLSATVVSANSPDVSEIFTLRYSNISADLFVHVQCIEVLSVDECKIEENSIKVELSETKSHQLVIGDTSSVNTLGDSSEAGENETGSRSDTNNNGVSTPTISSTTKKLYIDMILPFNNNITKLRRPELIKVYKVQRTFTEYNECTDIKLEQVDLFKIDLGNALDINSLVKNSAIRAGGGCVMDNAEFLMVIERGALMSTKTVANATLPATNDELRLHFAIDYISKAFELMGPDVIIPILPKYYDSIFSEEIPDGMDTGIPNEEIDAMYGL